MVLNGIDRIEEYETVFKGKNLALITSPTGMNSNFVPTIDILNNKFKLKALFSPEHGVRGNIFDGENVESYEDPYAHIPVYSLYRRESKHIAPYMLNGIDMVVFDIQDVGSRFYTFLYTMLYAMEDCAEKGVEFAVLDRANPLGGEIVEGNILDMEYSSFVGAYPLCVRYGLTGCEFAQMANKTLGLNCNLTVVPCAGLKRNMLFPQMGRIWIMPSLALPTFESALVYAGTCIFESTNISEGRGTSAPFQIIGAPFIDAVTLSNSMNAKNLPGVYFRPVYFSPSRSKHSGEQCQGVQIHVLSPHLFRSVRTGTELLFEIRKMYPDKFRFLEKYEGAKHRGVENLSGGAALGAENADKDEILKSCEKDSAAFKDIKKEFEIY